MVNIKIRTFPFETKTANLVTRFYCYALDIDDTTIDGHVYCKTEEEAFKQAQFHKTIIEENIANAKNGNIEKAKNCNHLWGKAIPLTNSKQRYVCLNCGAEK